MKKILCIFSLSILTSWCFAQPHTGIIFSHDSLQNLLAQAKKEHKLIFIDCYTSWCGPCKWLDSNVFRLEEVGKVYNDAFICTKIDMEKGEGITIAKEYDVRCYPTMLFLDGNGAVVHRVSGAYQAKEFLTFPGKVAKPNECYGYYDNLYTSGAATPAQFIQYLNLRKGTCLPNKDLITEYENNLPETAMASRDNWTLLTTWIQSTTSRLFQYMVSHRSEFDARYTADSVDIVIDRMYSNYLFKTLWKDNGDADTAAYTKAKKEVLTLNIPITHKSIMACDLDWYSYTEMWDKYVPLAVTYLNQYGKYANHTFLNNTAWSLYEHTNDTANLSVAVTWAERSVAMEPHGFNADTYAALLYKVGRYEEAKTWAKIAISLLTDEGENYTETEKLLQDIEAKLKRE